MATELDRRVVDEQPTTWPELVTLGVGVARAVLGEEPKRDVRSWVRGCEPELSFYDQATSSDPKLEGQVDQVSLRQAESQRASWGVPGRAERRSAPVS